MAKKTKRPASKRPASKKAKRATKRPASKKANRSNPALKSVSGSTGWIRADAVRFVKVKGKPVQVLVKRSKRK